MKIKRFLVFALLVIPVAVSAQNIQSYIVDISKFLSNTIIPFIFSLAFFFFIWNTARYFIIGAPNEDEREKAKKLALWGIIALVLMLIIWGVVNLLLLTFDIGLAPPLCPDFLSSSDCAIPITEPVSKPGGMGGV